MNMCIRKSNLAVVVILLGGAALADQFLSSDTYIEGRSELNMWYQNQNVFPGTRNARGAIGTGNSVKGRSFAVGYYNTLNDYFSGYGDGYSDHSLTAGRNNVLRRDRTYAFGRDNYVAEHHFTALGANLDVPWTGDNATLGGEHGGAIVGSWNNSSEYNGERVSFGVGIGTSSGNRRNGLTVYKDGEVVVGEVQGDIEMGQFSSN